jgi:putative transposase
MVTKMADYPFSSYHHNALGQHDELITEHSLYKALGDNVSKEHIAIDSY